KSDDLAAGFSDRHGDLRARKALANRAQRRQAQHDVAELAEIDDEDVARIEGHGRTNFPANRDRSSQQVFRDQVTRASSVRRLRARRLRAAWCPCAPRRSDETERDWSCVRYVDF